MELELSGKAALVTGSSRGLGRAIAESLSEEGCRVALNGRNTTALTSAAAEIHAVSVAGDVTDFKQAQQVVSEAVRLLGKLDILVCNVGSGRSVPPGSETYEEWQSVFSKNLWSTTNAVQAAREALAATHGSIVCISSICGLEVISEAPITYSTAKSALNAYVRGVARPLGRQGIRINAVAPGNIHFEGSVWERKMAEDARGVRTMLEREVSLQRLGAADEVASLVVYLASARAGFASGGIWTLDGGQVRS